MDYANFFYAVQGNVISVGLGLLIFIMAYLSNMCFSTYYNVRVLGEEFKVEKLTASAIKVGTFGVGTALLTMSITLILPWANQNGLNIPEEYSEVLTTVAILGVCLTGSLKYILEAFTKMGKILNSGNSDGPTVIKVEADANATPAYFGEDINAPTTLQEYTNTENN